VAEIDFILGSEQQRLSSSFVPPRMTVAVSDALKMFLADGVTPVSGLVEPYTPQQAFAAFVAAVTAQVQAVASRPVPAPRTVEFAPAGAFNLGYAARGPFVNSGFTVGAVSARCDAAPTGAGATFQIVDFTANLVLYTFTIPAGATTFDDPAAAFTINDQTQIKLNCTQVGSTYPGRGLVLEMAAGAGSASSSGIGSASALTAASVGGASISLVWQYTGDPASTFTVVTKPGSAAPATPTDGTATTVSGSVQSAQDTGLTANTTYSFGVWPVASDGTLGGPAFLTAVTTLAADTTPPGQISGLTFQASQGSVTFSWTWPTDADVAGVTIRQQNNTGGLTTTWSNLATITTIPSEGHPSAGALSATGTGLNWTVGQGNNFTRTGLTASTYYSFAFYTYDAAGNYNQTPVVQNFQTAATPAGNQGDNAKIPATYTNSWSDKFQTSDLTAWIGAKQTLPGFEWWGHLNEGPTAHANVDVITDPILGGANKVMRMRMQRITNGWANSTTSFYSGQQGWFANPAGGYYTDGTGWYGARLQNFAAPSQASGAWEFTWWMANADGSTATAFGNNSKGLTAMWFPDTGWPQDEMDVVELFNAVQLGTNNHFKTATGGNGQTHAGTTNTYLGQPFNVFAPITTTVLWEPPPAGTGGVSSGGQSGGFGRFRIWHKQTGVTGDSGVGTPLTWYDTDKPYVGINMTDDTVWRQVTPANPGHIGLAVAWIPGSVTSTGSGSAAVVTGGAGFGAATGSTATTRQGHAALIRKMTWWNAA
jgi:hypothetical protein